jgi:nucleotide-binding universal stress UspA family protein
MGFNEQSFRAAAKEAGYNDSEIESAVASQKQRVNTATGKPFGEQSDAEMKAAKEKVEAAGGVVAVPSEKAQAKAKEQSFGDKFLNLIDPTSNPFAGPIEAILGYKAAEMAANKAKDFIGGLKDRSINKSPMAKGGDVVDVQAKEVAPVPKDWQDIVARSEQNAAAKAADAAAKAAAQANPLPQNYTAGVPSGQPNAPVNPAGAFTQPSGYGQTTSNVPSQVNQPPTITSPVIPTAEVGPLGNPAANAAPTPIPQPDSTGLPAGKTVSTGATPAQAEAPIIKTEELKQAIEPTGMKPNYNKGKKNPIGPGAYNWLAGQEGPKAPETWRNIVGDKNIKYDQFMSEFKPVYEGYIGSYGEPDPFKQVAKPGEYKRPSMIPENIRGSSNLKSLAGLAGTAGLLMAASTPESKAAMARASEAIKDIGISPEAILRGKGDELGRMGNAYVTAGNPNYLRELKAQLDVETNPERRNILLREFQKIGGSGAGRGIARPSAYMR